MLCYVMLKYSMTAGKKSAPLAGEQIFCRQQIGEGHSLKIEIHDIHFTSAKSILSSHSPLACSISKSTLNSWN